MVTAEVTQRQAHLDVTRPDHPVFGRQKKAPRMAGPPVSGDGHATIYVVVSADGACGARWCGGARQKPMNSPNLRLLAVGTPPERGREQCTFVRP